LGVTLIFLVISATILLAGARFAPRLDDPTELDGPT
jgi:hypothetical protein